MSRSQKIVMFTAVVFMCIAFGGYIAFFTWTSDRGDEAAYSEAAKIFGAPESKP
jgi:hypothetical protein